jgi:hypothetical protein
MDTFAQMLADKNLIPDDVEVTVGTHKFKMSDIRGFTASDQQRLSNAIEAAKQREQVAITNASKAGDLITALETASNQLAAQKNTQQTVAAATATAADDNEWQQPWWSPARKQHDLLTRQIDDWGKKIDAQQQYLQQLTAAVQKMASIGAHDRWHQQFDRVSPRLHGIDQYKDWDYKRVLDYATTNNYVDEHGMPSIDKAVGELTRESDLERVRKEAYDAGIKAGQTKGRMASMIKPASITGGKVPAPGKPAVAEYGLEGLGDDVAQDAELMEQLNQLGDLNNLQ